MEEKQEQEQQLKIPQTIEEHKREALMYKILWTVTGMNMSEFLLKKAILWVIVFATFVILKFVPKVPYGVCIGVNIGVCMLMAVIYKLSEGMDRTVVHKSIMSGLFGYLWSHQLCQSHHTQLIVLTLISIGTSIGPVILESVPQFTSPTLYVKQFNVHSVLYIRLLLPLPLFIIQLILDYGKFFDESTHHLYYIRLTISLVFLMWIFGWISTIYNTYFFLINNINKFIFGDQNKTSFTAAFGCLVLNCIPIAVYLGWAQSESQPVWILLIGSTISSVISFIFSYCLNDKFKSASPLTRSITMIMVECIICGGLVALMVCVNFADLQSSIEVISIIDLAIYAFFVIGKFLSMPRNCLGFSTNFNPINNHYMRAIERVISRVSAGFTVIILIENLNILQLLMKLNHTLSIDVNLKFVQYFFFPFIIYRSYKRSISESTSFSFNLSVLICLGLAYTDRQLESILVVLFFPPFPHNFFMVLTAPFTIPKKLKHKYEFLYQLLYISITTVTLMIYALFIGMFEFSMLFGLPFFVCVLPTINEGNKIKSKEHSLYEKIVEHIPQQLINFQKEGFYLLRISKYIVLVEVKQQWYGFGQTIDIKGLEVQEVTSCHSKEGETIDRLVEETWGDGIDFFNINHLLTVLSPVKKWVVNVPTQNEIQLTGLIESKQFVDLFKDATLKGLVHQISKIKYSKQQLQEGEELISDISPIYKKEIFQSLFPFQFANQLNFQVQYPEALMASNGHKKKLPPIKNKKQIVNDFMDLLESSPSFNANLKAQTSTHYLNSGKKQQSKQVQEESRVNQKSEKLLLESNHKVNLKELNLCLAITLFHYSVGKFDYFNVKKVYDLINMEKEQLSQVRFLNSQKILSKALSKAFKIAIDKITMGQVQISVEDFSDYEKNSFLGIAGSQDFNQAVSQDAEDIWTLNYSKGKLSVKRLAKSENELYMFKADPCIIKSVWNNLRFQLIYAANDNDERYSIQTHPNLMRNLWTEACEQPFGYPSYHSGNILNA